MIQRLLRILSTAINPTNRYVVYSTNHDKLQAGDCTRVVIVSAQNAEHMHELLQHMEPINPNDFLIFEEIIE